ncbi:mannose ABC transporter membrane protein /fructose ABC transporter membrane protein /ribose ABC transporter membrane protein [Roseivivax lentus]|uniref:Mannose ABC transporter membrane protein /fructose ABC transporter membrane protein /ribose ABC transporter membrane protein n=1 Tax=Roseivivax lentus TaxID=633194 RepID=A0A1N7K8B9_9RHOB|nr:ABC transporter permease [Roseivivax lentus]SIS57817.1 mannose ABC transporter membrane protein /fructose ABC transporter membrane protein /ribose ABC transporter membrane protein [Roseivivax lentus]
MSSQTTTDNDYESASAGASSDVASFEPHRKGFVGHFHDMLHTTPALVPLIVLVGAIIVFGLLLGSKFFSPFALTLILQQVQIVGVLAAAQSLVILTAGIDLSVGALAVLSSVLMGQFTFRYGIPPAIAVALGLTVGTAIGALNGWLVSRVKLPPFIVTLGMWQIVLAANYLFSRNETIRSQEIKAEAPFLQFLGIKFQLAGATLTLGVLLMLGLILGLAYALRATAWGRHVYAVGDDPEAAKLAGVNVHRTIMSVYMLVGFICALAGWVMIGRFGSVTPSASTGMMGNIQSITAVVIGGISLFGGRGSILGAFFGALIVGVFELGLRMAGADPQWTYLLIGVLIIGAVTVDQWIRKVSA